MCILKQMIDSFKDDKLYKVIVDLNTVFYVKAKSLEDVKKVVKVKYKKIERVYLNL